MLLHPRTRLHVLPILAILSASCGVLGEKGAAIFQVGSNWGHDRPIALGSTFAVSAQKNNLLRTTLNVKSTTPTVIASLPNGSFQAVGIGSGTLQALEVGSQAMVDEIDYDVAKPATAALAWWGDLFVQPTAKLDEKFAVVQGAKYVVSASLLDANSRALHHANIATLTGTNFNAKPSSSELFEVTPTVLGPTTATLTVKGLDGKVAFTPHDYVVRVVTATEVAKITLTAVAMTTITGSNKPTDADAPPATPPSDAKAEPTTRWYGLVVQGRLADGERVYGPPVAWTEATPGHLLSKSSNGGNYALLKAGEKVTVTAQVGALTAQVELTGP